MPEEGGANRPQRQALRRRLRLRDEFALALMPSLILLVVMGVVEAISQQPLLFASLASSAFLIYLDPHHHANNVRTLITAHVIAALTGLVFHRLLGTGFTSGSASIFVTIILLIAFDAVHPPAAGTSLSFAYRSGTVTDLALFLVALLVVAILVMLERFVLWLFARLSRRYRHEEMQL